MKENLINDVEGFFENKELYKKFAVPWKRGVILHGVPGNGKTISIKTLINTLNSRPDPVSSLYVKSFEACRGEKASIQKIFDHARRMAPCLLIFEDLDSLVGLSPFITLNITNYSRLRMRHAAISSMKSMDSNPTMGY